MEDSSQKPGSSITSKKPKSLPLESIYAEKSEHPTGKSAVKNWNSNTIRESKVSKRKHRSSLEHDGYVAVESRKKRSRKNISLNNFVPISERCQKDLNASRSKPNDLGGASLNESDLIEHSAPRKDEDSGALNAGNLERSNCVGDTVVIPIRPHGILGKTKYSESSTNLKCATNDSICDADDQTSKLSINLKPPSSYVSIDKKKKKKFHELMDNGSSTGHSYSSIKVESGNVVNVTLRKARRRKNQSTIMENRTQVEAQACLLKDEEEFYDDFLDDDEENLEQNAARMLSSRFDPRWTGFLGNKMASVKPTNGSSLQSSRKNFKGEGSEMVSADAASRLLRPRKCIGKSLVRKRRHFYEVNSSDVDPYWVIKQRIRVYWPLDKTWYFGVVKNYDPVTKMHHVKYDDRDEEWIDLHNERFKLLLFPSEVAGKLSPEKLDSAMKQKSEDEDRNDMDENSMASVMESEPIISWFTRLTHAVKSSKHVIGKKQQRIHPSMHCRPSISSLPNECKYVNKPIMVSNKLSSNSIMPDWSINEHINEVPPVLERRIGSDDQKISFVYIRKCFRKREKGSDHALDNSASVGGPIDLLASVADNESALEELHNAVMTRELKQITWNSIFLCQGIRLCAFEAKIISLCNADFLFHHGKLMHIWPTVHMEIVIVDNVQGFKILTFEGCLRLAVAVICLIMSTIHPQEKCNRLPELHIPFTSVGFKLSGLHHERKQLVFMIYSFMGLESSKWKFLEKKLRQQCISTSKLPIADCTLANVKSQLSISNHLPCAYAFEEPDTSVDFAERDCSDILRRGVFRKLGSWTIHAELCYPDDKRKMLKSSALCFPAQPSFFLNMHLKSLMDKNASSISFQNPNSKASHDCPGNYDGLIGEGYSPVEDSSDQVSEVTLENLGSSPGQTATSSGWLNYGHSKEETDALSISNDCDWMKSSQKVLEHDVNMTGNSVGCSDLGKNASNETGIQCQKFCQGAEKTSSSFPEDSSSPDQSDGAYTSCLNESNAHTIFSQVEEQLYGGGRQSVSSASKLVSEKNGDMTRGPNTTTQRSIWHHNQQNLISPKFDHYSKLLPEDFVQNGFFNTTRKPRSQVSCSSQLGNCGSGSKNDGHQKNGHLCKKIRTANRMLNGSEVPQAYLESVNCNANVLVTVGDRGRRECGAQVVLDSDGQKNWWIAVKFSGVTKFVHKANQFLQPGTSNRYTHAMMWKGGTDWTLEFTNRSHWSLFKAMHEECHNRNLRAASIKNIPVPGVRQIDDGEEDIVEVPVIRSSNYHRQIGTEVEMALDPSHVLYDIDSDDEEWISKFKLCFDSDGSRAAEVTDDMFERIMDMLEKIAYAKHCDIFTDDELVELVVEFGPLDTIKAVYEHWHEKRQKKGLPLIRQFQPPLWECYEQRLREWELGMSKIRSSHGGCHNRACHVEKPPMFAFCLKPRGLEVPNKCLKLRSHKKLTFTGHHYSSTREKDGLCASGRKLNEFSVGGEKALISEPNHELSYLRWHSSPSGYSPRDNASTGILTMSRGVRDISEHPKLHRITSKKSRMLLLPRDSQNFPFSHIFSHSGEASRIEVNQWSTDACEWPGTKQSQLDEFQRQQSDMREFRLHDASSAAQHASNMAKLKREQAQWLLRKADIALHKATVAFMIAEAIKASQKDVIGDG